MERGSRIITCLQTLEKVTSSGLKSGTKFGPDDVQQLRCSTSKILQYLQTQDKTQRDLVMKNSAYIDLVLTVLENANDTCTEQNLVSVLSELIGKSQTSKRVSTLVSHGATHILFHILVLEAKQPQCSEELLYTIHQVLAKLGHKDRKFGVKARLSQALGVTLNLLRSFINSPRFLQPIVHVLKLYSANVVNASYLGKNGAVSYLFKVLAVCARKHLSLCKYTLDSLALLVKSKSNSARAIGQGGVTVLLTMFYDWHRVDSKNRHVSLRKSILSVLKNITNLQSGRRALMEVDGIRILYSCCQETAECREVETIIFMASLIMRKCFPKNRLPISSLRSPLTYRLPQSDFHVPDSGEGQDGSVPNPVLFEEKICERSSHSNLTVVDSGEENGYESSVDNDDDVSSDDDVGGHKMESDEDGGVDGTRTTPPRRTWDDLMGYRKFFKELYDFDLIIEEDEMLSGDRPIVIPTALNDQGRIYPTLAVRGSHSTGTLQASSRRPAPTGATSGSAGFNSELNEADLLSYCMDNFKLGTKRNSDPETHSDSYQRSRSRNTTNEKGFLIDTSDPLSDAIQGPSAVNLKTGLSVFSLDIPLTSSPRNTNVVKKTLVPQPQSRSPKAKRRLSKGSKPKERKKPTKVKQDDWQSFDPLKSLLVQSYNKDAAAAEDDVLDDEDYNFLVDGDDLKYATRYEDPEIFADIASRTKSVGRFNKLAYPDMYGHLPPPFKEPLFEKKFGTQRQKIFEDIDRFINPDQTIDRTVYDLDTIVATAGPTYCSSYSNFSNRDEIRVSRQEETTEHLKFNSQFECGNLRKAIQVRKYEYDLILNPDVNTNHHHQWFYFEVSNMEAGVKYRFNIVNCEKLNSQFNFGMKPVLFSVTEAMQGRPHWVRSASEICYYKNHFVRSTQTTGGVKGKSYYTTTFTVTFKHEKDVCYLAYHYPYSYSMLQYHLYKLENSYDSSLIYYRNDTLCESISGNSVPVLTITSHPASYDREGIEQFKNRPYIFLSSRVHPGESNSSWVMKGTISYLLSNKTAAQSLRDSYIFKVVPMLNPDGVINGTHRCSLVAEDLNRRWLHPCPKLHPTIYHTKGLLQYLQMISKAPLVFCDYHGHSRKKNVFLYGCCPSLSWMTDDVNNPGIIGNRMEDTSYKTLPRVLHTIAPSFSLNNCSFMVEKAKESTARVVVWRQIGVVRSYTMESSYCGCDQGPYRGNHISTRELEEMGRKFCEGLIKVKSRHAKGAPVNPTLTNQEPAATDLMAYPSEAPEDDLLTENVMNRPRTRNDLESLLGAELGASTASVVSRDNRLDIHGDSGDSITDSELEEPQEDEEEEEEEVGRTRDEHDEEDEYRFLEDLPDEERAQSVSDDLPF